MRPCGTGFRGWHAHGRGDGFSSGAAFDAVAVEDVQAVRTSFRGTSGLMVKQRTMSSARKSALVVSFFLAVAAISQPRVPQVNEFTAAGWAIAGVLLTASLAIVSGNYRRYSKASDHKASRKGQSRASASARSSEPCGRAKMTARRTFSAVSCDLEP